MGKFHQNFPCQNIPEPMKCLDQTTSENRKSSYMIQTEYAVDKGQRERMTQ